MKVYLFLKGIGILTVVIGGLESLGVLSSLIREGSGTWLSLVSGVSLVAFGIVLAVLGDLGERVICIQKKLDALPEEDRLLKDVA